MRLVRDFRWVLLFFAMSPLVAHADVWTAPVSALAQKIVSRLPGGTTVAISVTNMSSLSAAEVNAVRAQIDSELHSRGLRFADQANVELRVTLSENVEGYLWVADIRQGDASETILSSVPRPLIAPAAGTAMTLQRRLLWSQDEPILDVAMVGPQLGSGAIVLTATKVAYYKLQDAAWREVDTAAITHTRPLPRDLRGMIFGAGNSTFEVALPGTKCIVSGNNPFRIACAETDDPWPIYDGQPKLDAFFSPARDFFTGAISKSGDSVTVPPFYSSASFGNNEWLFTGIDGRVRYSDFVKTSLITGTRWGSELTSMRNRCSADAVVLATRNWDYTQPDAVQGYQVIAREPVSVTPPLEFAGPVTMLRGTGESAIAVSQNLKTGKYEAYLLTLACNR